ncbi:MAG TPA: type I glyceraldehyde-3-phosphate dehydrogenase [Nitrospirota bacterium]|nr:type I glyceraldehyde-3-phosphate dehydrogenase [Nitrospirota bacterium]
MKRIAINGLGRIGRLALRLFTTNPPKNLTLVAANSPAPTEELAYLIKYDSVHGRAPFEVKEGLDFLEIERNRIAIFHERNPESLPWRKLGVDIILECSGQFRKREEAEKHIIAGASKVIISAEAKNDDLTIVLGVNEKTYDSKKHSIISNASCTTNCLATTAKVLNDAFGIDYLWATTIHAYTASQALIDKSSPKHRRRGRAAAVSIIPSSTGAATATERVLPELKGKMSAIAVRVPVANGSLTDITARLNKDVTIEMVNEAFRSASEGALKGILGYTKDELVSADIVGDEHSSIIDANATKVIMDRVIKVFAWYDNEYGYTRRLLDLANYILPER